MNICTQNGHEAPKTLNLCTFWPLSVASVACSYDIIWKGEMTPSNGHELAKVDKYEMVSNFNVEESLWYGHCLYLLKQLRTFIGLNYL